MKVYIVAGQTDRQTTDIDILAIFSTEEAAAKLVKEHDNLRVLENYKVRVYEYEVYDE